MWDLHTIETGKKDFGGQTCCTNGIQIGMSTIYTSCGKLHFAR
jgi:hypothetical protein